MHNNERVDFVVLKLGPIYLWTLDAPQGGRVDFFGNQNYNSFLQRHFVD
ncbi:Unknown protein sequence [Pseudomonas coronafaciens pv. oryzae]|nr:Unknown protein sequence [Pseudomonas coronafaciens pv. oryzae]